MRYLFVLTLIIHSSVGLFENDIEIYKDNEISLQLSNDSDVCNSIVCERAGKALKANLNPKVEPCDDFYEFACGGWMASHTIADDKSMVFGDVGLQDTIEKILNDSLSQTRSKSDSKAVIYSSDLFKSCMDSATRELRGVSSLLEAVEGVGGWPVLGKGSKYNDNTYDWKESYIELIAQLAISPVFAIDVGPDANDTKVNRFNLNPSSFGLGNNELLNPSEYPDIVRAYKQYITKTALLLGAKNDSQTHKDVEDLFAFEQRLANQTLEDEESDVWYNRMSFEKFNEITDKSVDWLNLTNRIYSKLNSTIRVKSDELVIVQDIEYYKEISKLLAKTPKRVIANYFGFRVIYSYGGLTTDAFRKAEFDFSRVTTGVVKDTDLWEHCVDDVSQLLQYAVSRLYIDKSFTKEDKKQASIIINDIKEAFYQLIAESNWLDNSTKNMSEIKLKAIHNNVGYPDWILNNHDLDKYYDLKRTVDSKKFFESFLYVQQKAVLGEFISLREAVNLNTSWPMPPILVNAAYEPTQNSITIPSAQLTPPYFDVRVPAHINYGAIGSVVGHELTHGFDDQGSEFDANGNLRNWWTEETGDQFVGKAECFINEYNNNNDTQSGMRLNGNNTIGENIADNGGIRESFRAYQLYVKRHGKTQRLPFVSQYTSDQQFFISYANTWCTKYRTEYLKNMIEYNVHSPAKYRVNIPVSNFKTFSDAFKCKPNSRMNIKDKCVLW